MAKDEQICALEQELKAAKKLVKENTAARWTAEEQAEQMGQDFEGYQKRKREEHNKLTAGA